MARPTLPTVGGSGSTWGNELNDVLTDLQNSAFLGIEPFRDNYYYDSRHAYGGQADAVALDAANRIYFCPFYTGPDGFTADRVQIAVTSGAAGNCRLGAYDEDATTYGPGDLIADWGEVDVTTTGNKSITIDTLLQGVTPRYRVWLAIVGAVQPTLITLSSNTGRFGNDSAVTSGGQSRNGFFKAHTYGALPDPITTPSMGTNVPIIFLRKKTA